MGTVITAWQPEQRARLPAAMSGAERTFAHCGHTTRIAIACPAHRIRVDASSSVTARRDRLSLFQTQRGTKLFRATIRGRWVFTGSAPRPVEICICGNMNRRNDYHITLVRLLCCLCPGFASRLAAQLLSFTEWLPDFDAQNFAERNLFISED